MEATQRQPRLEVTIRELVESDLSNGFLDALAALSEVKLTPEQAQRVYQELAPNLRTFVAVGDGRVVGTTRLLVERKFIHGGGLVGHIEDVAVVNAYQHRGVGTTLVAHAVGEAKRLGCYKVILDCFDDLAPFYERVGFRPFNRGLRLDLSAPR